METHLHHRNEGFDIGANSTKALNGVSDRELHGAGTCMLRVGMTAGSPRPLYETSFNMLRLKEWSGIHPDALRDKLGRSLAKILESVAATLGWPAAPFELEFVSATGKRLCRVSAE